MHKKNRNKGVNNFLKTCSTKRSNWPFMVRVSNVVSYMSSQYFRDVFKENMVNN